MFVKLVLRPSGHNRIFCNVKKYLELACNMTELLLFGIHESSRSNFVLNFESVFVRRNRNSIEVYKFPGRL